MGMVACQATKGNSVTAIETDEIPGSQNSKTDLMGWRPVAFELDPAGN